MGDARDDGGSPILSLLAVVGVILVMVGVTRLASSVMLGSTVPAASPAPEGPRVSAPLQGPLQPPEALRAAQPLPSPPPASAQKSPPAEHWLTLRYLDVALEPRTYDGWESGFDWNQVAQVTDGWRDGRSLLWDGEPVLALPPAAPIVLE